MTAQSSNPAIDAHPLRIVRLPEVMTLTGLSKTVIYRRMKRGEFPTAIDLGGRAVGWRIRDVTNWLASRARAA